MSQTPEHGKSEKRYKTVLAAAPDYWFFRETKRNLKSAAEPLYYKVNSELQHLKTRLMIARLWTSPWIAHRLKGAAAVLQTLADAGGENYRAEYTVSSLPIRRSTCNLSSPL